MCFTTEAQGLGVVLLTTSEQSPDNGSTKHHIMHTTAPQNKKPSSQKCH